MPCRRDLWGRDEGVLRPMKLSRARRHGKRYGEIIIGIIIEGA